MEVWEKVFVKDANFVESTHGKVGCVICHGGDSQSGEKELAHAGLVTDPSETNCSSCHGDIAEVNGNSLHTTLTGMKFSLEERGGIVNADSPLGEAFDNHCSTCHTTCGQCHVSRPEEAGGGLLSGHEFRKTPSTQNNCTACHGSRIGDEYLGNNEGLPGDVHWTKGGMICTTCHSNELHGSGQAVDTRYQNPDTKKCTDCHQDVISNPGNNLQHQQHAGNLSCQVCHSMEYSNCYNCHVGLDEKGLVYRTSDPTEVQFKIGLNPLVSPDRPYKYVVVRHVPVSPDTFIYYGDNLLPDFNALPTWKYATPHNIQLDTPQNASCAACHGNADLFLTEQDVSPGEREANKDVVINKIPGS